MSLLASALNSPPRKQPLLVLQSSIAQTCLPILSYLVNRDSLKHGGSDAHTILFCLLYSPTALVTNRGSSALQVYDWTDRVPGYTDEEDDTLSDLLQISQNALDRATGSVNIVIDSLDTLQSDQASLRKTYKCLQSLMDMVKKHGKSRLVLHTQSPSELLPLVTQTNFNATLIHLTSHPLVILAHLASEFLTPPPPLSPAPKFWNVFIPLSSRLHDVEALVFGKGTPFSSSSTTKPNEALQGPTGSGNPSEFVVELVVRDTGMSTINTSVARSRKREVERILQGWMGQAPCPLEELESLRYLFSSKKAEEGSSTSTAAAAANDPTKNLSFNLTLTPTQQQSRAQVPLPYVHDGQPPSTSGSEKTPGAIYYDPDSADDIDDDDPDEDLDI